MCTVYTQIMPTDEKKNIAIKTAFEFRNVKSKKKKQRKRKKNRRGNQSTLMVKKHTVNHLCYYQNVTYKFVLRFLWEELFLRETTKISL